MCSGCSKHGCYVAMTRAVEHVMALYDAKSLCASLLECVGGEMRATG
jgi:hypothetical protein